MNKVSEEKLEFDYTAVLPKLKKVYIVTQGCYSDYHIVAVFSNKEIAEKYAKKINSEWDPADVEEWGVDAWVEEIQKGYDAWEVRMKENGEAIVDKIDYAKYEWRKEPFVTETDYDGEKFYIVYCLAKSKEHAIKIASERITMYKARKAGIE